MSISYQKKEISPKAGSTLKFNDCESKDSIFIKILVKVPSNQITSGKVEYKISATSADFYKFSGNEGDYIITRPFTNKKKNFYREFTKKIICTQNTKYHLNIRIKVYDNDGNIYPLTADSNIWHTQISTVCP